MSASIRGNARIPYFPAECCTAFVDFIVVADRTQHFRESEGQFSTFELRVFTVRNREYLVLTNSLTFLLLKM